MMGVEEMIEMEEMEMQEKELEKMEDMEEMEELQEMEMTEEMEVMESKRERGDGGDPGSQSNQYPVHHVPDDAQPVEAALDPVHRLLLAQVVAQVAEVAVQEDLPLFLRLDHHLPLLLLLLGSHVVQFLLWVDRQEETQWFCSTHSDSSGMQWRDEVTWAATGVLHHQSN